MKGSMMDVVMRMPDLATVDPTVTVIGWLKAVGQSIERGEPLLEVETDKAILPVESAVAGVLREIAVKAGEEVANGQMIATITVADKQHGGATGSLAAARIESSSEQSTPNAAGVSSVPKLAKSSQGSTTFASSERVSLFARNRQNRVATAEASLPPVNSAEYPAEFLMSLYERMLLIREFEEGVKFLFLEGAMPGTIHQCQGQEATAVGVCAALNEHDLITSTFRGHGHALAKGLTVEELLFELFGASTGCCRGKGGSMHVGNMEKGMVPGIAIVGGGIPLAAGMALAIKMRKSSEIVACFFGDGAVAEGAFHEGINLAAIWDLPVIFVCENNLYGASTRVDQVMRNSRIADRASGYGIKGQQADGNDVLAVYEAAHAAAADCRAGRGPVLLELLTYRRTGHSRRDACHYQPKDERDEWFRRDPIERLGRLLFERGMASQTALDAVRQRTQQEFQAAVENARRQPMPKPDDLTTDVLA
jgi:acetoin:2,6-dichlorophenolindophenol oxidoreductase subunit alpha